MSIDSKLQARIDASLNVLRVVARDYSPAVFANSFGAEDMVITDLLNRHNIAIDIFSLDTGRLPEETYALMQTTAEKYTAPVHLYFPESTAVESFVQKNGINAFYQSVELRKECCNIRKVQPLRRALQGKKAWLTGLRREQAPTRKELPISEWDEGNGLQKFNPLTDWSEADIWNYIRHFDVPYNELHDRHYPSIGCAPCTRAIAVGEDIRAGRWWWENPESKECGLHVKKAG